MLFWKRISPDNGYCLFFPNRAKGKKFVAGRSIWVSSFEEWKHIKLGLFHVSLPGAEELLVTTSEQLTCGVKAHFGIVIGGPEQDREERLAKATISCPPKRVLTEKVEFQFFENWAKNYCRTAIINKIKECQFILLIEDPKYRQDAEAKIEKFARDTLGDIGLLLVQCTVVVEPNEPKGVFATEEIVEKWQKYRTIVSAAEIAKLKDENLEKEKKAEAVAAHEKNIHQLGEVAKRDRAILDQETSLRLRELAQERKRRENNIEIAEHQEISEKDKQISVIKEEMALRAQEMQLQMIRREEDLKKERERKANELVELQRRHEDEKLTHHEAQLAKEKIVAQKELEVQSLKKKLNEIEVELEEAKGTVAAANIEREILAKSADQIKLRQLLYEVLPRIAEQCARPVEKISEIRSINFSGNGVPGQDNGNIGTILASASTLPMVREILRLVADVDSSKDSEKR